MRPEQENPEQENINNVQLLLNRLSEVIQTPQVVRSCINAYNCLPREKILAIPSLSLALSKLDGSSGNDAVKYSTVSLAALAIDVTGISPAVILGRKVARNLAGNEKLEALKNTAKSLRPMMSTAAGMAIIVAALESAPLQEAFNAAGDFIDVPSVENPVLMGAIIGGVATELCFTSCLAIDGVKLLQESEAMSSARDYAALVAQQSILGCRDCVVASLGGQEAANRLSNQIHQISTAILNGVEAVSSEAFNMFFKAITLASVVDLSIALSAKEADGLGSDASLLTKAADGVAVGYASLAGLKTVFEASEAGYKAVDHLSENEKMLVLKDIAMGLKAVAISGGSMAVIVAALNSIPQQEAFSAASEFLGVPDVDPVITGAILGGAASGVCFALSGMVTGVALMSQTDLAQRIGVQAAAGAGQFARQVEQGAQRAAELLINALPEPARIAVAPEDLDHDLEANINAENRPLPTPINTSSAGSQRVVPIETDHEIG